MSTRMIIPYLRRHAMLVGVTIAALACFTVIAISVRFDSIQLLFTHGKTKLNIEATRR